MDGQSLSYDYATLIVPTALLPKIKHCWVQIVNILKPNSCTKNVIFVSVLKYFNPYKFFSLVNSIKNSYDSIQ